MTAANHTLTGVLIGATVTTPLLAVPIALASHLVLDVLPHFGGDKLSHTDARFFTIVGGDVAVAATILGLVVVAQPTHWLLMITCGVVAASPDLLWIPYWVAELKGRKKPLGKLAHFLSWIQWGERMWGWIFELIWFVPGTIILVRLLER